MKQLLVISYDFPPSAVGIWRTLKYCRYLPEFGWEPSILTVKPVRSPAYSDAPLKELPPETEVRKTESLDPNRLAYRLSQLRSKPTTPTGGKPQGKATKNTAHPFLAATLAQLRRWVFIPDDRALWKPFALREGRRWLLEKKFDAVYTTSFPHTAHLVGEQLAREFNLPLLADFRDSWTGNYEFFKPATPWHRWLQLRMEARVVTRAARVVTATGPITQDFQARYQQESKDKFLTITNGFDPVDYPEVTPHIDTKHFTISYVGTMFGAATPKHFLAAIRMVLKQKPEWHDVLRLRFLGSMTEPYQALIPKAGLQDITTVETYKPHDEALEAMAAADSLLLLVPDVSGAEIMLTQKVFEYAAAGRPIIGLCPEGAARDFLREIDQGCIHHPKDVKAIAMSVRKMIEAWEKDGRQPPMANPKLKAYERRNLTERLACVLNDLIEEKGKQR